MLCVIADHIQTTTLLRTFRTKGGHDYMTSVLNGAHNLLYIPHSLRILREEVEYGSVVPNVKIVLGQSGLRNIRAVPVNLVGFFTNAISSHINRMLRYIENTDVTISFGEQIINVRLLKKIRLRVGD